MVQEQFIEELDEIVFDMVLNLYQQASSEALDPELKIKEHMIIEFLGRKGAAKMSQLAAAFGTPSTTMTSIVNRLVDRDYLKRERSSEDRRVVLVMLSDKGKDFFATHDSESKARLQRLFSCLSKQEIGQLADILDKLKSSYQAIKEE